MKKRIGLLLAAALLLAGCNATQNSSSENSGNPAGSQNPSGGSTDRGAMQVFYQDAKIASVSGDSIYFVPSGALADLYPGAKITDVTAQFTAMGEGVYPLYLLDDGRMITSRNVPNSQATEYGIYSPADGSYRKLFDNASVVPLMPVKNGDSFAYLGTAGVVQNRWLVFDVNNVDGTSHGLCLCDINTGELKRIYAYTPPVPDADGSITTAYLVQKPVISGDDIYWDDIAATRTATSDKGREADINVWHYSASSGEAEQAVIQAWHPFVYKGELYYFGNGGKPYTSADEFAGIYKAGSATPAIQPDRIIQLCSGSLLASVNWVSSASYDALAAKNSAVPKRTASGDFSGAHGFNLCDQDGKWKPILVSLKDYVGWPITDGRFVVWGGGGTPSFYDSKKNCIVTLPWKAAGESSCSCYLTPDKLIFRLSDLSGGAETVKYLSVDKSSLS